MSENADTRIEQAMEFLRRGDRDSLEKAISLLQGLVVAFSMTACSRQQEAEDVAQEVLLRSIPYLPRFENSRALGVWLYKVTKNQCLMHLRRSKYAPRTLLSLEGLNPIGKELERLQQTSGLGPEAVAIRREQARQVREAIGKLPVRYRIVLVLHDLEGLNDEEVSEITGLRPGTIRVRLHRARSWLRKELARRNLLGSRKALGARRSA